MRRVLLILPCNQCIRLGDFSVCSTWRRVIRSVGDLIAAGVVELAAMEICKPGILIHGEERWYTACNIYPSWERFKRSPYLLDVLVDGVARDLRWLAARYDAIAYYINVKAFRIAIERASREVGVEVVDLGPPEANLIAFSKYLGGLRGKLESLAGSRPL